MMIEYADLDGLVIHDLGDRLLPYTLSEANFGSGPEPRLVSELRPSAHGSVNRTRWYGPRLLELSGLCNDGNPLATAKALDALKRVLALDGQGIELRFRLLGDEHDYTCTVRANSKLDAPARGYQLTVRWGVTLEAPDPRYYGAELLSVEGDPADAAGIDAFNPGTFETPVVLTVIGPGRLSTIKNDLTNEEMFFGDGVTLVAGDELVIDTNARTVTLNGVLQPWLVDASLTNWLELHPGVNTLHASGTDWTGASLFRAEFREARI